MSRAMHWKRCSETLRASSAMTSTSIACLL
jgi:hypothetical protein